MNPLVSKVTVDLSLLNKTDQKTELMRELEAVFIKIRNATVDGKFITGIISWE